MCTGIRIKPEDGSVIFARTCEFGADLDLRAVGLPAGKRFVGSAPGNGPGLEWTGRHAAIGANTRGAPLITVGGLNEHGLHCAALNFAGFTTYQNVTPADHAKSINCFEVATYVLTTATTVDEALAWSVGININEDGGSRRELLVEHLLRQRVFQEALQRTPQRPGAHHLDAFADGAGRCAGDCRSADEGV